ncbi:DUF7551 domain-containing protein [Natrialba aegyptia]|uniref:Uncharacterized protein n=1 Tax=Natrialba aegyptia DSM 13077 TaxID=1227491 RepID=M0B0C9_9EURY|nr:hypothetical protein [Natrialba aegyptia]ELZ03673.1 hypothetical protein C480_14950 [Natrialba aegyptia DSM 13077]
MIGTTLHEIRSHIASLASESGRYYLICGRTHHRPVPAADLYFESRSAARAAAQATEQYRTVLRRYDPQVPYYDVIVCECDPETPSRAATASPAATADPDQPAEAPNSPPASGDTQSVIDVCHTVAGVVFESIAESPHDGLENAIMDTYLDIAETIEHPDELCLQLLTSTATELEKRLDPDEQLSLLSTAAANLPIDAQADAVEAEPLDAVLAEFQAVDMLESYRVEQRSVDAESESRSWTVRIDGYALGGDGADGDHPERIVTLPIIVELFGRLATRSLTITDVERLSAAESSSAPAAWRLTIRTGAEERSHGHGLACVRATGR